MENTNAVIQVTREETAPCCQTLKITVPAEMTQRIYKQTIRDVGNQVKLPGFRSGKIPANVLTSHFAKEIQSESLDRAVNAGIREAVKDLRLATSPKFEGDQPAAFKSGEPLEFSVTCETAPVFIIPEYKGIKVTRTVKTVSDDDVADSIRGWLEQMASYEKIDRPAAANDLVKVNYKAECPEGVELTDEVKMALEGSNSWLFLREPERFPGISVAIAGMSAGDAKDVQVSYPANHNVAALAGRTLTYHVELIEVHGKNIPALDEKALERAGVKTEEELKDRIRKSLETRNSQEAESQVAESVISQLLAGQNFELPPSILHAQVEANLKEIWNREAARGAKPEEIRERGVEYNDQATKAATMTLRRTYMLMRLADAENIQVAPEEMTGVINYLAHMEGKKPEQAVQELQKSGRLTEIYEDMRLRKTVKRLVELANITDVQA